MPKRGENIHKRKDGRWEGRYIKARNEADRAIYGYVYGKTYRSVKEKMLSIREEKTEKKALVKEEKSFQEVLQLWLETNHLKYKGATENKYRYLMETHIVPELGMIKVSQISTLTVNEFLERKLQSGRLDKQGGLSPSYVRSMMLIINAALEFAVNEQMCLPLRTPIYKPTLEKKELPILSVKEQKRLEAHLFYETDETKLGVLLSLNTGLRIGEVCALTWENIDFTNKILHVRSTIARIKESHSDETRSSCLIIDRPKTKASIRDIPIPSVLMPLLEERKKYSTSDFVISKQNSFLSPRTYEYRYHKLLDECELRSINYHALRHTFATRCIEVGVDVKSLSEILGHANVATTLNTYVHSSMDLKRAQIEKLSLKNVESA